MPTGHKLPRETIQERLRVFREALGPEQTELSRLIGVGQPMIWRWENDPIKPKSLAGAKAAYLELTSLLASRDTEGIQALYKHVKKNKVTFGRMPEEHSPIEEHLRDLPRWVEVLFGGGEKKWRGITSTLPFQSTAPWRASELLRLDAFGAIGPYGHDIPAYPVDAIEADLKVHGKAFVKAALALWTKADHLKEGAAANCARVVGSAIVRTLFPDLPRKQTFDTPDMVDAPEEVAQFARWVGTDDLSGSVSPRWAGREDKLWLPAMDFLALVLGECRQQGKFDLDKLEDVWAGSQAYKMVSEQEQSDVVEKFSDLKTKLEKAYQEAVNRREQDGQKV